MTAVRRRKRSGRVTLAAMGLSVSALALTGCEEKVDAFQYSSVDSCVIAGKFSEAECNQRFEVARAEHDRAAPRFQSRADCEAEFGAAACGPSEAALAGQSTVPTAGQVPGQSETQASAGGGLWMPLMIGWMMGNALRGPVATQPLYRSPEPGVARTAAGASVDAKAGPVSVSKAAAARPPAGQVVARGGFGRTGGSFGTRSFGG